MYRARWDSDAKEGLMFDAFSRKRHIRSVWNLRRCLTLAISSNSRGKGFSQNVDCENIRRWSPNLWQLILASGGPDYYPKFGFVPTVEYMLE